MLEGSDRAALCYTCGGRRGPERAHSLPLAGTLGPGRSHTTGAALPLSPRRRQPQPPPGPRRVGRRSAAPSWRRPQRRLRSRRCRQRRPTHRCRRVSRRSRARARLAGGAASALAWRAPRRPTTDKERGARLRSGARTTQILEWQAVVLLKLTRVCQSRRPGDPSGARRGRASAPKPVEVDAGPNLARFRAT